MIKVRSEGQHLIYYDSGVGERGAIIVRLQKSTGQYVLDVPALCALSPEDARRLNRVLAEAVRMAKILNSTDKST